MPRLNSHRHLIQGTDAAILSGNTLKTNLQLRDSETLWVQHNSLMLHQPLFERCFADDLDYRVHPIVAQPAQLGA